MSTDFIIVMGVTGCGKTTIGEALAAASERRFCEGDGLHPAGNVAKMAAGLPLTDADRWPWLQAIGAWIDARHSQGDSAVLACSALRRAYRDLLRDRAAVVRFCWLSLDARTLDTRLRRRGGHFMPASLLPSQLATLQPLERDEPGVTVPAAGTTAQVTAAAQHALGLGP